MLQSGRATTVILILIVLTFLLTELFGGSTETRVLIKFGALWGPLVWAGQFWRLLTAVFLHIGLTHLLMNSFALYIWGQQVEEQLGSKRFIFIFLSAGIAGNMLSLLLNPLTVSAGASGGIFGLFAAELYLLRQIFGRWEANMVIYAIFMLMYGFMIPAINGWAHLGGAMTGFIATSIFNRK